MALINCPNCGQTISDKAAKCPHCGSSNLAPEQKPSHSKQNVDVTDSASERKTTEIVLPIMCGVCIFLVIVSWLIVLLGNTSRQSYKQENPTLEEVDSVDTVAVDLEYNTTVFTWEYNKHVDDLSGNVDLVSAVLVSNNELEYKPGKTTRLGIIITYMYSILTEKFETTVGFVFHGDEDGMCRMADYHSSGVLVSFDDGPIDETWSLVDLSEDKKLLAISESDKVADFISKIKQSKKCRIQVNTEQAGRKTFEFNTKGLNWDFE